MSEQNIIPSAPQLYPSLQSEANEVGAEFRLKKICDCQKQLEDEISHYKQVSKKYKRAKSVASKITSVSVFLTTLLASSSVAIAVEVPLSLTAEEIGWFFVVCFAREKLKNEFTYPKRYVNFFEFFFEFFFVFWIYFMTLGFF